MACGTAALASRGTNPVSAAYAAQAVALVGRRLPVAHADDSDLEARAGLMLGARPAGRALTLSGPGLVHGVEHAPTAHTGTPHGVALAPSLRSPARCASSSPARARRPPGPAAPDHRGRPGGRGDPQRPAAADRGAGPRDPRSGVPDRSDTGGPWGDCLRFALVDRG
ncbi:iron-containing alcohol dehydrogenase [Streptomyces sp. NPDC007901]|uniref:iron-containing alcohol dehydrogenase n=1 Tax=Streptomyces sp. NPDC007901 TaxID=3364785 RepID=UPI0036E04089